MHKSIMNFIVLLMLNVTTACADSDKATLKLPVVIFEGLSLDSLLAEPEEKVSLDKLESSLSKDWYAGIVLGSQDKRAIQQEIKNCQDYFKAFQDGKEPVKEFERSAYMGFGLMCLAARDTVNAKSANKTYVKSFVLDQSAPDTLPKQLAMQISVAESKNTLEDKNKVYWGDVDRISGYEAIRSNKAIYKYEGGQQEVAIVAKGDFNHDGIEDILMTSRDSVANGSYNALRMFLLTKQSASGEFVLLKEYKAI